MSGRKSKLETRIPHGTPRVSGLRTSAPGLRTVIIGYGNPTRSDDAVGWHASGLLSEALGGLNVEVISCHQLTPELAETLSQCQQAVFIDADVEGRPGEVHRRVVRSPVTSTPAFTHTCTPAGLLASARQLYGRCPLAIAITVSAQSFDFGETLSPPVSAALAAVVSEVCKWLGIKRKTSVPVNG